MSCTLLVLHKCNLHLINTATQTYNYFNCKTSLPLWLSKSNKAELNQLTISTPRLSRNDRRRFPNSSESRLHQIIQLVSFQSLFQITDSNTLLDWQILHLFNISSPVWRQESEQIFRHLLTFSFLLALNTCSLAPMNIPQYHILRVMTHLRKWFLECHPFYCTKPQGKYNIELVVFEEKHQTKRELQLRTSETKRKNWSGSYK